MHRSSIHLGLATASLLLACSSASEPSAKQSAPAPAPASQPASALPPPKRSSALTEAALRDFVTRWAAAQNQGKFADYAALYATNMTGVKRAGPRTYSFNRARWLGDRERMFKRPMQVSVDALQVAITPTSAVASFTQRFQQGNFQDEGPKQLVIVDEGGTPKIAREEMLSSRLNTQGAQAGGFYFVVHVGGRAYVVLDDARPGWASGDTAGPHKVPGADERLRIITQATSQALPATKAGAAGRVVRVYDEKGGSCESTLGPPLVMHAIVMYDNPDTQEGGAPTAPDLARSLLELAEGAPQASSLIAPLERCDGVFAVDAGRAVRVLGALAALPGERAATLLAPLREHEAVTKLQREYTAEGATEERPHWIEQQELFATADTKGPLLARLMGGDNCAEYTAALLMLLDAGQTPARVRGVRQGATHPRYLIDLDEDGKLEVISGANEIEDRELLPLQTGAAPIAHVPYAFLGCGC